ncbi:virulence protein [Raccoonpox virus]|uniref:Virulence protein n=1 Tax=Raccoon poxvirus TaxID=10256 RepID=A0A0G3FXY5_RACVI|nr:virulence protein [Raccoonpox virus]AKJ93813.1 virulence protein [Raccoonpox virus]AOP31446.1 virulence protein [Raccoonpox virus]
MYKKILAFLFVIDGVTSSINHRYDTDYIPFNKLSVKLYIDGLDNIESSYIDDDNELVLNFEDYRITMVTESCDVGFDSIDIDFINNYKIIDMYTIFPSTEQSKDRICKISTKLSCHDDNHPYIYKYEGDYRQYSIVTEGTCYKGLKYEISTMNNDTLLKKYILGIGYTSIFDSDNHQYSNKHRVRYDL